MKPLHRTFLLLLLTVGAVGLLPVTASACPFCEGGPSGVNEVKEAIFGDGFWFNLIAASLPFVVVFALALVIHGVPTGRTGAAVTGRLGQGGDDGRPQ
jgi:hypothetical protein